MSKRKPKQTDLPTEPRSAIRFVGERTLQAAAILPYRLTDPDLWHDPAKTSYVPPLNELIARCAAVIAAVQLSHAVASSPGANAYRD